MRKRREGMSGEAEVGIVLMPEEAPTTSPSPSGKLAARFEGREWEESSGDVSESVPVFL